MRQQKPRWYMWIRKSIYLSRDIPGELLLAGRVLREFNISLSRSLRMVDALCASRVELIDFEK